ncbi:hypothetical protein SSX86_032376, partial [Deinandra increscens subsp. villosa]
MEREKNGDARVSYDADWEIPKKRRWKRQSKQGKQGNGRSNRGSNAWTSYYFTNFPDECSVTDLQQAFDQHGIVMDVFIAKKINSEGERFGFVKFARVFDKERIESGLNSIKVGHHKLSVNLERFDRFGLPVGKGDQNLRESYRRIPGFGHLGSSSFVHAGKSYMAAAAPLNPIFKKEKVIVVSGDESEACVKWKFISLIGILKDLVTLQNIHKILKALGARCDLKHVGGLCIMLYFGSVVEAEKFLLDEEVWM